MHSEPAHHTYAIGNCSAGGDLEPRTKTPLPLSLLTLLPPACCTEQGLPEPVCPCRYQSLTQKLAMLEEWKRLQMLRAGEFKSSLAMWNPTFETLSFGWETNNPPVLS